MFEDIETHKKLSKWIIGTFTACILIYLGIRHISHTQPPFTFIDELSYSDILPSGKIFVKYL